MVVYLDYAFAANAIADSAALYLTARLSGLYLPLKRAVLASLLGGLYGVLSLLPFFVFLSSYILKIIFSILLVRISFGRMKTLPRVCMLFFAMSCILGGGIYAFTQSTSLTGFCNAFVSESWKAFLLVTVMCYILLSAVFYGSANHAVMGQLCRVYIEFDQRNTALDALLDSGHTLCDPVTGSPVLIAWYRSLESIWPENAKRILSELERNGCLWCAERLGIEFPGKFCLIPYRSVGVDHGILLAFRSDKLVVDGKDFGALVVALSPTPVSDGGGYSALWNGEEGGQYHDAA